MNKPAGYDEAEVKEFGEFETLPVGNYKCKIVKAIVGLTGTQKEQISLLLDIADGQYKDFYKKQFDNDARPEKKWGCIFRQLTEGNSTPFFKAMITAIEKSNKGYIFNFDERTLEGKLVGGQFGVEEYEGNDGKVKRPVKCRYVRSVEGIDNAKILEDKLLQVKKDNFTSFAATSEELLTDDIPF